MLTTAPLFALVLLSGQFGAARDVELAPLNSEPYCDVPFELVDAIDVATLTTAEVGGYWWISKETDNVSLDLAELTLLTGDGGTLAISPALVTSAAVALPVPPEAIGGEAYFLNADGALVGEVLRVAVPSDEQPPAASLSDVGLGTPVGVVDCYVDCFEEGRFIPAAPAIAFTHQGAAVLLDVWVYFSGAGGQATETARRLVDSRLLPQADEAIAYDLVVGDVFYPYTGLEIRVRARDPQTLALLYDDVIGPFEFEGAPFQDPGDVTACSDVGGTQDTFTQTGCAHTRLPATEAPMAALLVLLVGPGLLRRRRRA